MFSKLLNKIKMELPSPKIQLKQQSKIVIKQIK